ncbi:MAG: tetratricopeptide repeat protein [Nitrospinae bacterium]|nr:tetratricopeptide repeat protein [Nitrospinota bacterium]
MNSHYKRLKSILLNTPSSFWTGIIIITSLIVIVYYNTITSPFNFDDESEIVDNKSIRSLSNIPNRLTNIFSRPVLYATFTLNYYIGGFDPTGYHAVNIGLHVAVSILMYLIMWNITTHDGSTELAEVSRLTTKFMYRNFNNGIASPSARNDTARKGVIARGVAPKQSNSYLLPFLSAALFAIHPINTESVTYIVSRSSVLSTFFYLLSFLMFIKANKKRGKKQDARSKMQEARKKKFFSVFCLMSSVFCFVLAIGSKEDAVTLPAILLLYHFFFISKENGLKDYIKRYGWVLLSLTLLAISYPLLRYIRLGIIGTSEAKDIFTPFTYFMTGIKAIIYYYMKLLLLPINLNVDPDIRPAQIPDFYVISALSLIIALLIVVLRKKNKLLSFSLLWYFIALTPTSSIFPLNDAASEHRLYLPSVGFCIFIASCLFASSGVRMQRLKPVILVFIIFIFSTLTIKRNFIWGDEAMVWRDSTRKSPNKPRPYYNMAVSYEKMGLPDKAIWGFKGTLEHLRFREQPHFWTESHIRLAGIYVKKGLYMNAIPLYDRVLKIYPEKPEALNGIGVVNLKMNNFEKAKNILEKVIKIKPEYAEAHNNLGTVYARMGMPNEALTSFKKAIKIKPDYVEARLNYNIVKRMKDALPYTQP